MTDVKTTFTKGDRVVILLLEWAHGTVINVRQDDRQVPILTITLDDPTQTADGYYIAREWEVLSDFQFAMLQLDCALTGKTARVVAGQMHHKPRTPVEWFNRGDGAWYLSDGGYSRIMINYEEGHIFLSSVSLEHVKAAWESCADLRAAVESHVCKALAEAS